MLICLVNVHFWKGEIFNHQVNSEEKGLGQLSFMFSFDITVTSYGREMCSVLRGRDAPAQLREWQKDWKKVNERAWKLQEGQKGWEMANGGAWMLRKEDTVFRRGLTRNWGWSSRDRRYSVEFSLIIPVLIGCSGLGRKKVEERGRKLVDCPLLVVVGIKSWLELNHGWINGATCDIFALLKSPWSMSKEGQSRAGFICRHRPSTCSSTKLCWACKDGRQRKDSLLCVCVLHNSKTMKSHSLKLCMHTKATPRKSKVKIGC